jgi:hypothetical protein
MSKVKLAEDAAIKVVDEILDFYEISQSVFQEYKNLLNLVINSRLQFTADKKLVLNLFNSVKNNEGNLVDNLTMSVLTGQSLVDAEKNNKNDIEQGFFYISSSANIPLGSVSALSTRDIRNCHVVISLFL